VPYPDTDPLSAFANCTGGVANPGGIPGLLGVQCYFDDYGNDVRGNFLRDNGFFGNATNGDLVDVSGDNDPGNCFHGNLDPAGVSSAPAGLQLTHHRCGERNRGAALLSPPALQAMCASQALFACTRLPGNPGYPQRSRVQLMALPAQPSMPDPCRGVPNNPWCPRNP
jgi:hypothetical protein